MIEETNRIEFKRELDIEKEVVAFLNYREGGINNFEFGDNYVRMIVPYSWVDEPPKVTGKVTNKVTGKMTGKVTGKVTEKTSDKILRLITANPSITIARMMVALSMSDSGIRKVLRNLQAQGAIRRVGSDKTGHWEIIEK